MNPTNNETSTPLTDAALQKARDFESQWVSPDFARELERELAAALAELAEAREELGQVAHDIKLSLKELAKFLEPISKVMDIRFHKLEAFVKKHAAAMLREREKGVSHAD